MLQYHQIFKFRIALKNKLTNYNKINYKWLGLDLIIKHL